MSGFDDRENAEEARHAHNAELEFKAIARRNKLLGQWAAQLMGLSGLEADDYAKQVVAADFEEPGDEDVFRKVQGDFEKNGVNQSEHQIRRRMDELLIEARKLVASEG